MSHIRALRAAATNASHTRPSLLLAAGLAAPSARARVSPFMAQSVRAYATEDAKKSSGSSTAIWLGLGVLGAGAGYYLYSSGQFTGGKSQIASKKPLDYNEVYKAIASVLENANYDDGSYGPLLVRLAWHASGTYSKEDGTGGSNGATMRFDPEGNHEANAGLKVARDLLEKVKQKFPDISYSDLWTLAGVCAIQEMSGPTIPWRPGRQDGVEVKCTPDGRLPDALKGQDHLRSIFYRMGFNDQEIVALAGAHALGRCHTDRSGFDGPWTPSPIMFTNDFFTQLLTKKWVEKKWKGPKQYVDKETGDLMMLVSDLALIQDKGFKKYVELYAKDEKKFFEDFSSAFKKLLELGVPFSADSKEYVFQPVNA